MIFWSHEMAVGLGLSRRGDVEAGCTKPISVSDLGFITSGEGWYLNLGWYHISGNSLNVNAREGAANGEPSNGFLQQYDRTGSM